MRTVQTVIGGLLVALGSVFVSLDGRVSVEACLLFLAGIAAGVVALVVSGRDA